MDIISIVLHAANIILALCLVYLYAQNYAKMKSKYTIGLILFSILILLHSAMGLYFDASMVMYSDKTAEMAATGLEVVKAISLGILLKISIE